MVVEGSAFIGLAWIDVPARLRLSLVLSVVCESPALSISLFLDMIKLSRADVTEDFGESEAKMRVNGGAKAIHCHHTTVHFKIRKACHTK
jgi:hypothetical protein